jgi:hypothetical protein
MKRSIVAWMGVLGLSLCMLGCGGGYDEPTFSNVAEGKLTKGGQPLALNTAEYGDYARIELEFASQDIEGLAFGASVADDGTFTFRAPEDAEISGKFRVSVQHFEDGETDSLGGKYAGDASPIELEITPGQEILIELDDYPTE